LVIRGASTQSLALVDEKAIIPKVESMPLMDVEEKEIGPQIPLNHDLNLKALAYILDELKAGREPLLADVATNLNTTTQRLGKSLAGVNVKATETRRAGIAGRYYTFEMKDEIEKILMKGE
jgi:hypothetical protein